MSGNRVASLFDPNPVKYVQSTGNATFTADKGGTYEVAAWGQGGVAPGGQQGAPGALAVRRYRLGVGQTITLSVGNQTLGGGTTSQLYDTLITFPDGSVMRAGCGYQNNAQTLYFGGVATGGDVNLNGSNTQGSQAPSYLGYIGGLNSITPGGGQNGSNVTGDALALIVFTGS